MKRPRRSRNRAAPARSVGAEASDDKDAIKDAIKNAKDAIKHARQVALGETRPPDPELFARYERARVVQHQELLAARADYTGRGRPATARTRGLRGQSSKRPRARSDR